MNKANSPSNSPKQPLLFLSHTHEFQGGAERSLLAMMKDATSKSYAVHLIVPRAGDFAKQAKKHNITIHTISSSWWTLNGKNEHQYERNRLAVIKMSDLIKDINPLACVTNTITNPWLAYAAALTQTQHLWIIREFGDTDHGLTFCMQKNQLVKAIDQLSSQIFTSSEALKRHYQELIDEHSPQIKVVYPVVKVKNQDKPQQSRQPIDTINIVCVGNISSGKGQMDAVKAVEVLLKNRKNIKLTLIGGPANREYYDELKEYVYNNNLTKNIIFAGYSNSPEKYVSKADLSLVCSRTEAFGRVTIESVLQKTAVIGTRSAGTADILKSYSDDILYTPGDSTELAHKISNLIDSPDKTKRIIENLYSETVSKYNEKNANIEFFECLQSFNTEITNKNTAFAPMEQLLRSNITLKDRLLSSNNRFLVFLCRIRLLLGKIKRKIFN